MKSNILIIEDEAKIARFVELELSHEGYVCDKAEDGRKGLEMAESGAYDLVLLDIMLPELNGLEVLRRLRKTNDVPVIVLTARDAVMDKVSGLDMGADDYVTKPFAIEELLARIRLALRRGGASKTKEDLQPGILSPADAAGEQERRAVPGQPAGEGLGLRLHGRDERGGRIRPLPAEQDRSGWRRKCDPDRAGRRVRHPRRT